MRTSNALVFRVAITFPAAVSMLSACDSAESGGHEDVRIQSQLLATPSGPVSVSTGGVSLDDWKSSTKLNPPSTAGCFTKSYPSTTWTEVPCVAPPARHMPSSPNSSASPETVGACNDWFANDKSTITEAEGYFPYTSNIKSVYTLYEGTKYPGAYRLQMNSNLFTTATACNGGSGQGWQQFEYSSSANPGVFMEYWLLNCSHCPSPWQQLDSSTCYTASWVTPVVPQIPVTQLSHLELYAIANDPYEHGDWVELYVGSTNTWYVSGGSAGMLSLYKYWNQVEFNVLGDFYAGEAYFNSSSSIEVEVLINSGSTAAPTCTKGAPFCSLETNNLSLGGPGSCSTSSGSPGKIWFLEHN